MGSYAAVLPLSLSFTGTILVGARRSLTTVFLVPKTGDAVLGLLLPHMNIEWRCATRALIDMVSASFLSQLICGTLYLLLPFHPLTICLLSKVRCIGTSEKLITNNIFYPFLIVLNSLLIFLIVFFTLSGGTMIWTFFLVSVSVSVH